MWECLCDCGRVVVVMSTNLGRKIKNTESCGCLRAERVRSKQTWEVEFRGALKQRYKLHKSGKPHPWSLTLEQFKALVTADCHYCGCKPSMATKVGGERRNGIDRVDSSRGYDMDNCVPCCTTCNLMKGLQSQEGFLAQVEKIHRFQLERL